MSVDRPRSGSGNEPTYIRQQREWGRSVARELDQYRPVGGTQTPGGSAPYPEPRVIDGNAFAAEFAHREQYAKSIFALNVQAGGVYTPAGYTTVAAGSVAMPASGDLYVYIAIGLSATTPTATLASSVTRPAFWSAPATMNMVLGVLDEVTTGVWEWIEEWRGDILIHHGNNANGAPAGSGGPQSPTNGAAWNRFSPGTFRGISVNVLEYISGSTSSRLMTWDLLGHLVTVGASVAVDLTPETTTTSTSTTTGTGTTSTTTGGPLDNLAGHWKFDEGSGAVALDSSGAGNNGSIIGGAPYVVGNVGPFALDFDGVDDYVSISDVLDATPTGITISAWVNADAFDLFRQIVGKHLDFIPFDGSYFLALDAGVPRFKIFDGTFSVSLAVNASGGLGAGWHMITATWDGGGTTASVKMYVDGVNVSAGATEAGDFVNPTNASVPLRIGAGGLSGDPDGIAYYFNGRIDDVRIYAFALSAAEVAALFAL